ncbi:MAG: hypothetical protein WC470_00420 [Candidatus Paceibacterota bacterium]
MFKITKTRKNQKGVSLFLVTIMIAVLVGFSLNVSAIIVGSAKITGNVANSIKAFHCADSGVEYVLFQVSQGTASCTNPASTGTGNIYNDAYSTYSYSVFNPANDCGTGTEIDSSGSFAGTTRKIHIDY